jgi:four helix bundle protein
MHNFEKLIVWQKSLVLLKEVYRLSEKLPEKEEKILINQIKRSALSVSLNIAEGTGAESKTEFKRFLFIARKSLLEVIATVKIIDFLYQIQNKNLTNYTDEVGKLLNGLINKLKD